MNYLSSNQVKKYIVLNFCLIDLFCLFDLLNFKKTQLFDPNCILRLVDTLVCELLLKRTVQIHLLHC